MLCVYGRQVSRHLHHRRGRIDNTSRHHIEVGADGLDLNGRPDAVMLRTTALSLQARALTCVPALRSACQANHALVAHDLDVRLVSPTSFKWDPGSASLLKLERPELATVKDTHAQDKMIDRRQIHWFGLTSMSVSLLAGIGFALGQHFFYTSLHGKQVPQGNYEMVDVDFGVSKQQVTTAIGTVLAFSVKSCLVLAVSTAYVQLFWKALAEQPTDRPFDLHNIDKAYSALRNATLLVNFPGWKRFPLLFILALTTWHIMSLVSPS
jgi:hypothetical protein